MNRLVMGVLLGLGFGAVDVALMLPLSFPDKRTALAAAFLDRFAIGFLSSQASMPLPHWAGGAVIGLLVSLPSAVVTKVYLPIVVVGLVGGAICGFIAGKWGAS
jgi:ABC-type antimicrobial peptide transport system permease subunit